VSPRILIVEDDQSHAEVVRYNLAREGFDVSLVENGDSAMSTIEAQRPDLVVLDWMIPGLSGIDVCRRLRRRPESRTLPIIMLTARGEEADRIEGLDSGADDYMVKPFSPSELLARIRALLRRAVGKLNPDGTIPDIIEIEDIRVDLAGHRVTRAGRNIHLGPTEFRLLRTLMESRGKVLSREQLLDRVWGHDIHVEARTVDAHIRRMRRAINSRTGKDVIRTVRGVGYAFEAGES
jgi:two-component system phosphate regulon response regulator PhoB